MKLNNKRTVLVGLAFLSICTFWQMYDSVITKILTETFHLNESITGAIMAADNVLALSWTLDRDKAQWFAHRFGENGTVYEAQITKQHIYAFLNSRGESEVIVDPRGLQDITESQDEGMALTQNQL